MQNQQMRAILVAESGGPEQMRLGCAPIPVPQAGEVLIKVKAAGVNRPDVFQRQGKYPAPPGASSILGLEVAGEIVGGDLRQSALQIGQPVCALLTGGGYAEYCTAASACCLPLPEGWSWEEAATIPETFFTVWANVWMRAHLQTTESLLVHGGGSGIGVSAIQLAVAFGHPVFVTVGSAEKYLRCQNLGAQAINYNSEDFVEVVLSRTNGQGVNVILDMVAGSYLNRNLRCLADDGRIAVIALLGGSKAEIEVGQILRRRLQISGSTLRSRSVAFKSQIAQALYKQVWPLLTARQIQPVIDTVANLEAAASLHTKMEKNLHFGKLVLRIS